MLSRSLSNFLTSKVGIAVRHLISLVHDTDVDAGDTSPAGLDDSSESILGQRCASNDVTDLTYHLGSIRSGGDSFHLVHPCRFPP